jgi:hypothetical protein
MAAQVDQDVRAGAPGVIVRIDTGRGRPTTIARPPAAARDLQAADERPVEAAVCVMLGQPVPAAEARG